ncbi:MAG: prepilin-type N-terminal cleavage/methylation domain-containing protein [Planctomycetes bacterium]|nr:prepilin-type N-terminal cleavage/methylation domain-containing protein [Planctomycetota bacterium]
MRIRVVNLKSNFRRKEGLTLLEVLIAMTIFSFGIVGVFGLLSAAAGQQQLAREKNERALLSDSIFAEISSSFERYADADGNGFPDILQGARNVTDLKAIRMPGIDVKNNFFVVHFEEIVSFQQNLQGNPRREFLVTIVFPDTTVPPSRLTSDGDAGVWQSYWNIFEGEVLAARAGAQPTFSDVGRPLEYFERIVLVSAP